MGKFDGKVCLVGGNLGKMKKGKFTMGLGGVIAHQLLAEGAQVCLVDLSSEVSAACAAELGGKSKAYDADIMKDRAYETEKTPEGKTEIKWTDNSCLIHGRRYCQGIRPS